MIGSGVAGLTAALRAQALGLHVLVITKAAVADGNTRWAQGGVAVVLEDQHDLDDSVAKHAEDTFTAGAGLVDEPAARSILDGGPAAVARLRADGARFDASGNGLLARAREGGHSAFRVIHAGGDATGAEVERALVAQAGQAGVPVLEHHIAVDALRTPGGRVAGVTVLDRHGVPGVVRASAVLVASGGIGQLYQATSNPEIATGDGLALALRAGATVADIEFVQFHPTVLYTPGARGRCPLVTEAVRGEGATLVDGAGLPVMRGVHPLGDLAPRDVVSGAITRRMATAPGGVDDHVFLDATSIAGFAQRFPTVFAACAALGLDPAVDPIPVTPAAHFSCGGVVTTVDGRSSVAGLYAAGEVARTGLHGANRLASNSLLEGLVVGQRVAEAVAADLAAGLLADPARGRLPSWTTAPAADRDSLQRVMSRYAAIGRDADGLAAAGSVLDLSLSDTPLWTHAAVEDAALTVAAQALLAAAVRRTESRGCHVRSDFPGRDDGWRRSQHIRLSPSGQPVLADPIPLEGVA
ncbi:L-aspartate oxidase [Amycolatopsis mediterranei S699]|uniref:L-aspartate oxidase n=2 Tax=Amycolatopsis mediterranei TaxID=33910 RepID=A0A0H3D1E5_AMYMU|nr:L-aspartate oxidase [Amycolatopsis mediterranei U32]AEK40756.1 L-aspartate oxidase [Amycolatopsis mediterranei S699]AFO75737.1 L-aspartate oxidase [Amycolatopsis mediterranei S699]AGT82866.1 L-aspartate oxidase [Amycolatopsis mediterranei RB]